MTALELIGKTLSCAVLSSLLAGTTLAGEGNYRIQIPTKNAKIGLEVSPLPLTYKRSDRKEVGYGSYIVNVSGTCNGCHAVKEYADGGDPFKGQPAQVDTVAYLRGGVNFGGTISASLRPDPKTGLPNNLTFDQFVDAMQKGVDANKPGKILKVMPWPSYKSMSITELKSIYKYLSALPSAESAAGTE
jgi:hypothetical protein